MVQLGFVRCRRHQGNLEVLETGMGLFLYLEGDSTFAWTRPVVAEAALVEVDEGWNLVAWGGEHGITIADALRALPSSIEEVWGWSPDPPRLVQHKPNSAVGTRTSQQLFRGGAIWIRSSAQTRWLQPGWVQPEVVLLDDVPVQERAAIRAGWEKAQRFQAEHYGVITSDFTAYIGEHYASIGASYREALGEDMPYQQCATAWGKAVFIILSTCVNSPFAHEYFHIVQQDLSAHDYRGTPAWLYEGSAEYLELHQIQVLGTPEHYRVEGPRDPRAAYYVLWSALDRPLTGYADEALDRSQRRTLTYKIGFLAVDRLVEEAGHGALVDYFRALASAGSWRTAFTQAFGISVDTFYAAFEKHRLEVAPPFEWEIEGTVRSSDGHPVEGVGLIAAVRVEGHPSPQVAGMALATADGSFRFKGPGDDYFLVLQATCGSFPQIFAGFGSEGFTSDWYNTPAFGGGDQDRANIVIQLPMTLAEYESRYCE